jgi:hypothetical protein
MTDAQGSARDHVETEWAEATEDIPGQRTASIPQKKKKRRSQPSRAKLCKAQREGYYPSLQGREWHGSKKKRKENEGKTKGLGFVVEFFPTRRAIEEKAG